MRFLSRRRVNAKLNSLRNTTFFAHLNNLFGVSSSAQRLIAPQHVRQKKLSSEINNKSDHQKKIRATSKRQHMDVAATNSSTYYKPHTDGSTQLVDSNSGGTGIVQRKTSSATHIDMASMLASSELENCNSLSRRLASSTEGRFTIIDEHYKESTDESFDDSDDGEGQLDAHQPDNLRLTKSSSGYCISYTPSLAVRKLSIVNSSPNIKQMAVNGMNCVGSRFKIVPVESRYKRGRWQAWDYYLDENGHYSHTNSHAPVVEEGQFRNAAVHLTGDSFPAPSRNSITNQTSALSQAGPLPTKALNPPRIAVVPPTPLPLTSAFPLANSSSAITVTNNPFSFASNNKPSSAAATPNTQLLSYVPSKSLINLTDTNLSPHSNEGGQTTESKFTFNRVPRSNGDNISSSPLAIQSSYSAEQGSEYQMLGGNSLPSEGTHFPVSLSPKQTTITTISGNDNTSAASSSSSSLLMPSNLITESLLSSPGARQTTAPTINASRPLTPSAEMLLNQYGLERSLSATSSYNDSSLLEPNGVQQTMDERQLTHDHFNNSCAKLPKAEQVEESSTINGNANSVASQNAQLVAIDSKIEQAMDLVKTHLIFAVREEVELLRSKILELETTVIQLEAENSILREHVPAEILQNLTLQPGANTVNSSSSLMTAQ